MAYERLPVGVGEDAIKGLAESCEEVTGSDDVDVLETVDIGVGVSNSCSGVAVSVSIAICVGVTVVT